MTSKIKYWFHPIALSLYPIISLLAFNITEIPISLGYRALGVSLIGALVLLFVSQLFKRNWSKASLLTSLSLILFYSYGHVYNTIQGFKLFGFSIRRHRYLSPLWALIFILGYLVINRLSKTENLIKTINVFAVSVLIIPTIQIINFQIYTHKLEPQQIEGTKFDLTLPEEQPPPDIYYIILDAYARDDALLADYGFDNTPFLKTLEGIGFYIAHCSRSNYAFTRLSLSSSLNMNYMEELLEPEKMVGNDKGRNLGVLIQNSIVRQSLEQMGYKTIAFETGHKNSQITDADIYLSPKQDSFSINKFEELLLKSSAALVIMDNFTIFPNLSPQKFNKTEAGSRILTLFIFEELNKMPQIDGPKFVFAHIISPHRPFVFASDGSMNVSSNKDVAYSEQVEFINSQIISLVNNLIANSNPPPIIIIQGDHGGEGAKGKNSRLMILNAFYLPREGIETLYPEISPVNSFRLIFNSFFSGKFSLLEDVSLFSTYYEPYNFQIIPESRPGCEE